MMIRVVTIFLLAVAHLGAEEAALNVISYNIRNDNAGDMGPRDWSKRKDLVSDYLLDRKAGIIGLQEVKQKQLLDLDKALPDHAYVGLGRDDGKTRGEYSPIFYDRRVWKVDPKEEGTFWLSDTPDAVATRSWGNSHNRICTWARLIGIGGPLKGKAIYVYNTHWDHRSQPSRVKSGELMLKRIKARSHPEDPFILMGDLNATTENPAVTRLLESGILIDHGEKQMRSSSGWKSALAAGLRIDHVFTSADIKDASVEVESNGDSEGNAGSDHHPVRLSVREFPGGSG